MASLDRICHSHKIRFTTKYKIRFTAKYKLYISLVVPILLYRCDT